MKKFLVLFVFFLCSCVSNHTQVVTTPVAAPKNTTINDMTKFVFTWYDLGLTPWSHRIMSLNAYKKARQTVSDDEINSNPKLASFDKIFQKYNNWLDSTNQKIISLSNNYKEYVESQKNNFKLHPIVFKTNIYEISILNAYYDMKITDPEMSHFLRDARPDELLQRGKLRSIEKGEILELPSSYMKQFIVKISVKNISTNKFAKPELVSYELYNTTDEYGRVVEKVANYFNCKFSDNVMNEYELSKSASYYTSMQRNGIRPGATKTLKFTFRMNQAPIDNIDYFNVHFFQNVFGKKIELRIPRDQIIKPDFS